MIWNHNAWDRDQQYFSWDQGSNFCGVRDQNSHHFWDRGSKFWVKIWDQLRRYFVKLAKKTNNNSVLTEILT